MKEGDFVSKRPFDETRSQGEIYSVFGDGTYMVHWLPYHINPNIYNRKTAIYGPDELVFPAKPIPYLIGERVDYLSQLSTVRPGRTIVRYTNHYTAVLDDDVAVHTEKIWPAGEPIPAHLQDKSTEYYEKQVGDKLYVTTMDVIDRGGKAVQYREQMDGYTIEQAVKRSDSSYKFREFDEDGQRRTAPYPGQRQLRIRDGHSSDLIDEEPGEIEMQEWDESRPLMEDPSTWPYRQDGVRNLSQNEAGDYEMQDLGVEENPFDHAFDWDDQIEEKMSEPLEGVRLPFEDLQQLQRELRIPAEEGALDMNAVAYAAEYATFLGLGYAGLAISGTAMLVGLVNRNQLKFDVLQEYLSSLRNAYINRSVYVYVRTPGDPSKSFKWWEGICKDLTIDNDKKIITEWKVDYKINLSEKYSVTITDASNIMIDRHYQPRGARKILYRLDKEILGKAEMFTVDKWDNPLEMEKIQHFTLFDPVRSSKFSGTRQIEEVKEMSDQFYYRVSAIGGWYADSDLHPSSGDVQKPDEPFIPSKETLPAVQVIDKRDWGVVILSSMDEFTEQSEDEIFVVANGFARYIFRDSTKQLFIQMVTDFANATTVGQLPFPAYI